MDTRRAACRLAITAAQAAMLLACPAGGRTTPVYADPRAPVDARARDLLNQMTLAEKVSQLNQVAQPPSSKVRFISRGILDTYATVGSVITRDANPNLRNAIQKTAVRTSRLGIPIVFAHDVIHGYRTIYPIGLGQASSWNPELVRKNCAIAAREACKAGIDWTFAPMIDVSRDARWGRIGEGFGEDPYLTSVMCVNAVKGYQGENLSDPTTVAACLKHYVGYGNCLAGRDYQYTEVSRQSLHDTFLPPFKAGVNAGVATVMSAFNDLNGIPASAHPYTLTEVLRNQWHFQGFTVSDWGAVDQLVAQQYAGDRRQAARLALTAGIDMNMVDDCYKENLENLVESGELPVQAVDRAVRRVLTMKFRLGLFEKPYVTIEPESRRYLQRDARALARALATESFVLLKNKNSSLPLDQEEVSSVAVIGPFADNREDILGAWKAAGRADDAVSILDGIRASSKGKLDVHYHKGCTAWGEPDSDQIPRAVKTASRADLTILCLGEPAAKSGENASRGTLKLRGGQEKLVHAVARLGKPIVVVLVNGRPLNLLAIEPDADAILEIWQPGVETGRAVADVLFGRAAPSGKLPITYPGHVGQLPLFYNKRPGGRPGRGQYIDGCSTPLYPFGHGLTYGELDYGPIQLSQGRVHPGDVLQASVPVTNRGDYGTRETVIWYITDHAASITQPVKKVKHFAKKLIAPGKRVIFTFTIVPMRDLSFVDRTGDVILEPGRFTVHAGNRRRAPFSLIR